MSKTIIFSQSLEEIYGLERILINSEINDEKVIGLLEEMQRIGRPYDGRCILKYVFSDNKCISYKAASVIKNLLTKKNTNSTWCDLSNSYSFYYQTNLINLQNIEMFSQFSSEEAAHLYGIASLNFSGYIREKALDYLQNSGSSEVFPYILLRLNDWVPEVRNKAHKALLNILPSMPICDILKHYDLINWLGTTERVKPLDAQAIIFSKLLNPRYRKEFLKILEDSPLKKRLFCWNLLFREIESKNNFFTIIRRLYTNLFFNPPRNHMVIDKAIEDKEPDIRKWALYHLPNDKNLKKRLAVLISDKAPQVRCAALKIISTDNFIEYEKCFEESISDPSKSIREYGRFILGKYKQNNFRFYYQEKISLMKDNIKIGLILGFIEVALEEDISTIKEFAHHTQSKIRAAALEALNRLKAKEVEELYILGIQDNSSKVRGICTNILKTGYRHLRPKLQELMEKSNIKSYKAILKVLTHHGELEGLHAILLTLAQPSEELKSLGWSYLPRWHRRWGSRPWFNRNERAYKRVFDLLNQLKREGIVPPPYQIQRAWEDLPNILGLLRK